MIQVTWDNDKNQMLKDERNISFEAIEEAILNDQIVDIIPHFNYEKYPSQEILIVIIDQYTYYVPFVQNNEELFLKTIIPSRKLNKIYNKKDK